MGRLARTLHSLWSREAGLVPEQVAGILVPLYIVDGAGTCVDALQEACRKQHAQRTALCLRVFYRHKEH